MVGLFDTPVKNLAAQKHSVHHVICSMLARSVDGVVHIAPGVAERILAEANFDGQRSIRKPRVEQHLGRLNSGAWVGGFPITFARLPSGELVLIDGQHRLTAIAQAQAPCPVRINIIDAADDAAIRQLYIGFDTRGSVRTQTEVLDGVALGAEMKLKRIVRGAVFEALTLLRNDFEPARSNQLAVADAASVDGRIAEFPEWEREILKWQSIYDECDRSHVRMLLNAGCTAVGMYTLKFQPEKAMEFWLGIARNDGLRKSDPRHTLIKDFHTRNMNIGSHRQAVQAPTLAWNAFVEGRQLKIIKCVEGAGIRIAGTPFANGPRGK